MAPSATANKKKGDPITFLVLTVLGDFSGQIRAIAFTQEELQDQRKSHLTEPKRDL